MANRAERRRSMKVSELREQAIEAMNQTPYMDVEVGEGAKAEVFRVWHPLLQDDEAQKRIDIVNAGEDLDKDEEGRPVNKIGGKLAENVTIRTARAIMGKEAHARFIKAGGRSSDIQMAWNEMVRQYEEMLDEGSADSGEDGADPKSE